MPTPLLFISDAPNAGTGLGRITRDLALRVYTSLADKFRIATLGHGGHFTREFGFPQYEIQMKDWIVYNLPEVWQDFAGDEHGIIFSIWDASRLLWLSRPENCPDPRLRHFLETGDFDRWTYSPMDASGVDGKITHVLRHTLDNFDRVLAYSKWSEEILRNSLDPVDLDLDWRPHGIDTSVFFPRHHKLTRHGFGQRIGAKNVKGRFLSIPDDAFFIGIVATNQVRKDWGLGIQAVAEMRKQRPVFLWCHTDKLERHWSLPVLLNDFGLADVTVVTEIELSDEQMAWCLSACDLTLGIGNAEGFGLPIFESLACGTPVVHCNDGGAAEHLPPEMKVDPIYWRLEGLYDCRRGVYRVEDWVEKSLALQKSRTGNSLLPPYLAWDKLWGSWQDWFLRGLK